MAMMISKFHKLIQSKTVWYIVLGVIIIAFVGFFTPTMNSSKSAPKATSVGELFGKKVKADELRAASRNTYLWMILSSGQMPEIDANTSAQIEQQAWVRMAALRKADKEGVIASDQEVIDQIQQMPLFQNQNRQFDPNVYKMILAQLKISSVAAEQLFREQIIVFKLMSRPTQAALISQEELIDAYKIYTDRFVLDYALLPQAEIAKTVTVTEEEAKTVFEANREAFRMPAKVMVEYVEVPVAQFVAQAEVPEGAALQVYNQNLQRFQIPAATNGAPVEYKAFEDVEEEINAEVRLEIARGLASEEATSLVVAVSPKGEGEKVEFFKTAIDAGFTVKTLPAFGPTDPINGIDETAPFRRVALNLQDDI